jgi:hypothetical protein
MKIFIFAIGGTGARVLKAVTMMLASGMKLHGVDRVIPIIVDLDIQNGDTNRTLQILDAYRRIREKSIPENIEESFFNTNLVTLGDNKSDDEQGSIHSSFQLGFGDVKDTFFQYLKAGQMDHVNQDLLNLLYDNSPEYSPRTELNLELSKGFKGNPNIGSIIFNDLVNTPEFKYFEQIFGAEDRIFIVSSIFGGTGASGFPQLVKNLRASNNANIKNAKIGACTVLPYFNVQEDSDSAIDSRNFYSKTKAALSYYETELDGQIEHIYYIGDKPGNDAYENHEGGLDQKNLAHVVELISGLSFINFANFPTGNFTPKQTAYYEYGIKKENGSLDFTHFHEGTRNTKFDSLTKFTFFSKLIRDYISGSYSKAYAKNINLQQEYNQDPFYIEIKNFVSHYFEWLDEMAKNSRGFSPFNLSADDAYNAMIKQKVVKGLDKTFLSDYFTSKLDEHQKTLAKDNVRSNYEQFMRIFYRACDDAFKDKVKVLPA